MGLLSLDLSQSGLPGSSQTVFQMRWYPYFSILTMLSLLFVIPHDPSTSLDPSRVGSEGYRLSPRVLHSKPATGLSTQQPHPLPRHANPAAVASGLLDQAHHLPDDTASSLVRLARLARARPKLVLRIMTAAATRRPGDELLQLACVNGTALGWGTTVEQLRAEYGSAKFWWGDLTPAETRALYHALLPTRCARASHAAPAPAPCHHPPTRP